jgi:hypothetical protein
MSAVSVSQLTPLQRKVGESFPHLSRPAPSARAFAAFCFPTAYKVQPMQHFVAEYMAPGGIAERAGVSTLLAYHEIGAGKTCAAIQIAERWLEHAARAAHTRESASAHAAHAAQTAQTAHAAHAAHTSASVGADDRVVVVMPASLVPGFRAELRSPCPRHRYITDAERRELQSVAPTSRRAREIVATVNTRIDTRYRIMSYNAFLRDHRALPAPPVLIVDEVQNVNNPNGAYYAAVRNFVDRCPRTRVVLLSGTPIFDRPEELVSLARLLRVEVPSPDSTGHYSAEAFAECRAALDGHVSYYSGAPTYTYPRVTLHYEICRMSKFQTRWYTAEIERELTRFGRLREREIRDNFYVKSRARANVVFPQGLAGTDGLPKLTHAKCVLATREPRARTRRRVGGHRRHVSTGGDAGAHLDTLSASDTAPALSAAASSASDADRVNALSPPSAGGAVGGAASAAAPRDLGKYSAKFAHLIRHLLRGELSFVYTNFASFGGVKTLRHVLRENGFAEFRKHGPGRRRFAVWTGDETMAEKDLIRSTYNSPANDDASQLQIVVGSPAMKEGVSLLRTRQVHVLEPYWNHSRHAQIFGRASRFCSHKSLPQRERTVDIWLYVAITAKSQLRARDIVEAGVPSAHSEHSTYSARSAHPTGDLRTERRAATLTVHTAPDRIDGVIRAIDPRESVDGYILSIANRKAEQIREITDMLKDIAVDRVLTRAIPRETPLDLF